MFISFWFGAMIAACILWVVFYFMEKEVLCILAFLCFCASGVTSCGESDWYKQHQKESAEEDRKNAIPHVIREFDGCKVYAFETDREHYFTRCGSTVTTETNWETHCGKACTKKESDSIVTEGNK